MKKLNIGVFFKTATSGLIDWRATSEAEHQPHIVQLAAHQVDLDTAKIIQSMDVIVLPDGWTIPNEAAKIHGITTEYATKVGIPEEQALHLFLNLWSGHKRIAHNAAFDNRIIRIATKRYSSNDMVGDWKECEYECTGQLSKPSMEIKKIPALDEAYKHFTGKDLQDAHTAIADVNACMEIYFAIKQMEANAA